MRTFGNIIEANSEIQRDLSKAPEVQTHYTQGFLEGGSTRELLNYSYVMPCPSLKEFLLLLRVRYSDSEVDQLMRWLPIETQERCEALLGLKAQATADQLHPCLSQIPEEKRGYSYPERLFQGLDGLIAQFGRDPYNRRMYLPVFQKSDLYSEERIPCTLGYSFILRGGRLHMTYLQRSCDFDRFWPSDVYLASELLLRVAQRFGVHRGYLYHFILSLHSYIKEEVY